MELRKLTLENYKSFQFTTEIVFPIVEDGRIIFPPWQPFAPSGVRQGATSFASSLRASSRRSLASFRLTSGYNIPKVSSFSFPSIRYFNRHGLPPAGEISRYSPPPSKMRTGFSSGLKLRMAVSVSGMEGILNQLAGASGGILESIPPDCNGSFGRYLDGKKVRTLAVTGLS